MHILSVQLSDGPLNLASHYHDAHQILFVTKGEIAVSVGERHYSVHAGSILLLSRFEEHSIRVLTPEYRRYTARISTELSGGINGDYLLTSVLVNRSEAFSHVVETGEENAAFASLFSEMAEEYEAKWVFYEEKLDLLLRELLISLYRLAPRLFTSDVSRSTATVQAIQASFERDYREPFSLSALSARYHVSPSHLARTFKRITGYAPMEYLLICRFSAAKHYLCTTDKPIGEIVELCGFGDESNFSRTFRARTGMTPSAFRRANRG